MLRYRPCGCLAKVERDGKPYCLRHDPVRKAERHEANAPKRNATEQRRQVLWAAHIGRLYRKQKGMGNQP